MYIPGSSSKMKSSFSSLNEFFSLTLEKLSSSFSFSKASFFFPPVLFHRLWKRLLPFPFDPILQKISFSPKKISFSEKQISSSFSHLFSLFFVFPTIFTAATFFLAHFFCSPPCLATAS